MPWQKDRKDKGVDASIYVLDAQELDLLGIKRLHLKKKQLTVPSHLFATLLGLVCALAIQKRLLASSVIGR